MPGGIGLTYFLNKTPPALGYQPSSSPCLLRRDLAVTRGAESAQIVAIERERGIASVRLNVIDDRRWRYSPLLETEPTQGFGVKDQGAKAMRAAPSLVRVDLSAVTMSLLLIRFRVNRTAATTDSRVRAGADTTGASRTIRHLYTVTDNRGNDSSPCLSVTRAR